MGRFGPGSGCIIYKLGITVTVNTRTNTGFSGLPSRRTVLCRCVPRQQGERAGCRAHWKYKELGRHTIHCWSQRDFAHTKAPLWGRPAGYYRTGLLCANYVQSRDSTPLRSRRLWRRCCAPLPGTMGAATPSPPVRSEASPLALLRPGSPEAPLPDVPNRSCL